MPEKISLSDRDRILDPEKEVQVLEEMKARLKKGFDAAADGAEYAKEKGAGIWQERYKVAADIAESYASLVRAQAALDR